MAKPFSSKAAFVLALLGAAGVSTQAWGQVVFNPAGLDAAYSNYSTANEVSPNSFFTEPNQPFNGITGVSTGDSIYFTTDFLGNTGSSTPPDPDTDQDYVQISSSFSGTLAATTVIPTSYNFTLSGTGSVVVTTWSLALVGDATEIMATGAGFGTFSGAANYVVGTTDSDGTFSYELTINTANALEGDVVNLTMDPNTGGFSINPSAVPEPSAYALILGLGALGFALTRRGSLRRDRVITGAPAD